jgi:hypothetical protein
MHSETISEWGLIIVSVVAILTFTAALIVAFVIKDEGLLNLTVGAAIANATTVVSFWLGSSRGSQSKDQAIAKLNGNGAAPVPPAAAPPA